MSFFLEIFGSLLLIVYCKRGSVLHGNVISQPLTSGCLQRLFGNLAPTEVQLNGPLCLAELQCLLFLSKHATLTSEYMPWECKKPGTIIIIYWALHQGHEPPSFFFFHLVNCNQNQPQMPERTPQAAIGKEPVLRIIGRCPKLMESLKENHTECLSIILTRIANSEYSTQQALVVQ